MPAYTQTLNVSTLTVDDPPHMLSKHHQLILSECFLGNFQENHN